MNTQPNHPPTTPDPLAVALSKLDPAAHGLEWNSLMFAAGRESKERALAFWRAVAGACAVAACGFAVAFFTRPAAERIVYREVPVAKPATVAPEPQPLPLPVPPPAPVAVPEVRPEPKSVSPVAPAPAQPLGWSFDPPAEQGAATRWLNLRNEVLTVGLGVLPDTGRKARPPGEK